MSELFAWVSITTLSGSRGRD